jgi:phosphatidylserine decarboxylase
LKFTLIDVTNPSANPAQILEKFFGSSVVVLDGEDDDIDRLDTFDNEGEDQGDEDEEPSDEAADDLGKADTPEKKKRRLRVKKLRRKKKQAPSYEFSGDSDVVGIVFLEIVKITDLPPEKNGKAFFVRWFLLDVRAEH